MSQAVLRAAGLATGLLSALLLAGNTALALKGSDFAELTPPGRRYRLPIAAAVGRYLEAEFPAATVKAAPPDAMDEYQERMAAAVSEAGIRPWQFWRTIPAAPFLEDRVSFVVRPFEDPGRVVLLAAGFRALRGIAPYLHFWLGALLCLPLLVWTAVELFDAGRPISGVVFPALVASSAYVVGALRLTYSSAGFYLAGLLLLVPWTVYAILGSAVTVVEMTPGLLPGADRDLVDILAKRVAQTMKSVLLNTKVVALKPEEKGIRVTFEGEVDPKQQVFSRVLVAVGRRPNSKIPGLEKTHVQVDQRGFIMVDEQRRTHEPSIFAIGDVVGEPMLAHKASHEGRVAVEVMAGENVAFTPRAIPAVVFTDPELAWAGLTETQAAKDSRGVVIAKFPWGASGRAITLDRTDGLTKLVLDPDTERLLGVGLVGPGAGELIAEGVLGIEMGANATDLKLSIHPHPTLTETMMESAEVFFGQATHVYRPKRP